MKKLLLVLVLASMPAYGATAFFTGKQERVTTVTNKVAWKCQYEYNGTRFWKIFRSACPSSVEVY